MTYSHTVSQTETFNVTHARHLAAKLATDLKRMQRFYGEPSDDWIDAYQTEATELLRVGHLGTAWYGFRRDGRWVRPTLRYTAQDLAGGTAADQDPGRVLPGADVRGASFYSYLTYGAAWSLASAEELAALAARLPFHRTPAPAPGTSGHFVADRYYSSGGRALNRSSLRSW